MSIKRIEAFSRILNMAGRARRAGVAGALASGLLLGQAGPVVAAPDDAEVSLPKVHIARTDYSAHKPEELLTYSFHSPSDVEKAAIRSYLAKAVPETEAGLLARAWLATYERDDKAGAAELLKRCQALNPKNLYCLNNEMADAASAKDRVAMREAMLKADDSFEFYSIYYYQYFDYLNELKDKPAADRLLAELRAKHPDSAVAYRIEAALHHGKPDEAKTEEGLLEQAVESGTLDFDVASTLADLRFDELSKKDPKKRNQALDGMLEYADYVAKTDPSRVDLMQRAYRYVGAKLMQLNASAPALIAYRKAFQVYPTPEVPVDAYNAVIGQYSMDTDIAQAAFEFLQLADRVLPNNPLILDALGKHYASLNQLEQARQYLERAAGNAATDKDRAKAVIALVQTVYEDRLLDFDQAYAILQNARKGIAPDNLANTSLLLALYVDRVDAGDFARALPALNDYEAASRRRGPVNDFWFDDRKRQLLAYLDDGKADGAKGMDRFKRVGPVQKSAQPVEPHTALAVSPDGRRMVLGWYPMQLWDIKSRTHIADLGRGAYAKFSPDGRYIAATSNFTAEGGFRTHELIVYDAKTGKVHARDAVYAGKNGILDFAWNPTGAQIVYAGEGIGPIIYDVEKKKRVRRATAPGNTVVTSVAWTRQGDIVTGQAMADRLLVWDANDLTVTRELEGVDWPHALAVTADSRYLAALDNQRVLSVWDTKTWKLRQAEVSAWGSHSIAVHPSAHTLLLAERALSSRSTLTAFDLDAMQPVISRDFSEGYNAAAWSQDGAAVYRASSIGIETLEADSLKSRNLWASAIQDRAVADTKNGYFITYGNDGARVWDVKTGTKKADLPLLADKIYTMDGGQFVARAPYLKDVGTRVLFLDPATGQTRDLVTVPGRFGALASAPGLVAIAHVGHVTANQKLPPDFSADVEIYDAASGKLLHRIPVPVCTDPETKHDFITDPDFEKISLSRDGTRVLVFTSWTDGFSTGTVFSKQLRVYNVNSGKLQYAVDAYKDVSSAWFDEQDRNLIHIVADNGSYVYDIEAGKEVSRSTLVRTGITSLALAGGKGEVRYGQTFIEWADGKGGATYVRQPDNLAAVAVFGEANRMALLNYANEVSFYELPKQ